LGKRLNAYLHSTITETSLKLWVHSLFIFYIFLKPLKIVKMQNWIRLNMMLHETISTKILTINDICCCYWNSLTLLVVPFFVDILSAALYGLYCLRCPKFFVANLRIAKMNLITSSVSPFHLTKLFNFTLIANNPNNHFIFFYDPFSIIVFSNSVPIRNGSPMASTSDKNNEMSLRTVGRGLCVKKGRGK